jgi:2-keto-4-pentenoate hydratase/2-oxohepta-3-ene-1,7-dioic acid hydratase in catechol pathway
MAGANYADHAREMRGLAPTDPVEKSPEGPFVFLKPTTTLIGHGELLMLPEGFARVDWEIELAVVIGLRADHVTADDALAYVAGYTIANDISVRDAFVRSESTEPPMRFDWFSQKGRATSCPCGPWITPSRFCAAPGDLALSLSVNGEVEQSSRTSELIFSVEDLVAYISSVLPLVPGDVICTGTPSGVGAGKGRFLKDGDVIVAEIEGIGALRNGVAATIGSTPHAPARI